MQLWEKLSSIELGPIGLGRLLSAAAVFALCLIVIRILGRLAHRTLGRAKRLSAPMAGFLETCIKVALWVLAAITVAGALGIPTSSLVALVSVVGLALSLSIQNVLGNVFSGITLLITKPFEPGDYVDIAGKVGTVKTVGLFYTVLDTFENKRVSIPNADVTAAPLVNYSAEPIRRLDLTFTASYATSPEQVEEALLEAAAAAEPILADPAPQAAIRAYQTSRIEYALWVWCKTGVYWDAVFAINEQVHRSFSRRGISMGFDRTDVRVISD